MGMDKVNVMSDIRAEFEAFIILPPHEKEISRFPEDGSSAWPGSYKNLIVDLAWDAWQASRQALEGDPFTWVFTDVNGKASEIAGDPVHRSPQDLRIYTALYTHPAIANVPEKWRTVMKELADDLESEIEARRSGDLDRRIERDLIVVKEARVLLDEQEPGQ
jgi:hypothetical protein